MLVNLFNKFTLSIKNNSILFIKENLKLKGLVLFTKTKQKLIFI